MALRAAIIQLTSGDDVHENIAQIESLVQQAAKQGAQLVLLPENAYFMRRGARRNDAVSSKTKDETPSQGALQGEGALQGRADSSSASPPVGELPSYNMETHPGLLHAQRLARDHQIWILVGSIAIVADSGKFYNRSVLLDPQGQLQASYDKIHLFDVTLPDGQSYHESARVQAGQRACLTTVGEFRLGLTICYDLRFPSLYRRLAQAGANLLTVPAAFTVPTGRAHWEVLLRARAIETASYILAPAQTGSHPGGRQTYGHSLAISPWGDVLVCLDDPIPSVALVDLELQQVEKMRSSIPSWGDERVILLGSSNESGSRY